MFRNFVNIYDKFYGLQTIINKASGTLEESNAKTEPLIQQKNSGVNM